MTTVMPWQGAVETPLPTLLSASLLSRVVSKGSYYCPATKRPGAWTSVFCDHCRAQPLLACVSFESIDLCLTCVAMATGDVAVRFMGKTLAYVKHNYPSVRVHWPEGSFFTCEYIPKRINVGTSDPSSDVVTRVWYG
jgi:hypothetical protein